MVIVMTPEATDEQIAHVVERVTSVGGEAFVSKGVVRTIIGLVGDIAHSRVARSNIHGMRKLGMTVTVAGPPTLIPPFVQELGAKVSYRLEDAIGDVDVIMMLRLQLERQGRAVFPSIREYSRLYGLTAERVRLAEAGALVMHPGPVNRGVEMEPEVADSFSSVILDQVANGVAVRMGILYLLSGVG